MAVVGSPSYFASRKKPRTPQELTGHSCINLRLPSHGGVYVWEFEKNGRALNVRVDSQLMFNDAGALLSAALNGFGLAYVMEGHARPHIAAGRLVGCLPTGARRLRAITSIIQAAASPRRLSRC